MGWAPKLASPSGETSLEEALHEQGQVRLPVLPASLPSGFLPSSACELGRISSPTRGLFLGFFDEVDAASGARSNWSWDPYGDHGAASAVS